MKILRSYILCEHIGPFLMSMVVFTFVLLVGNLVKLADLVINKGVGLSYVFRFFLYLIPFLLTYTIPMAMLTATLLAFGRLAQDNELTALRANGINFWRLAVPCVCVAVLGSLFLILLNDRILPQAHLDSRKMLKELGLRRPTAYLEPGTFIKDFPPYVLFVYGIDGNQLSQVRIYEPQPHQPTRTIVAERGEFVPLAEKNQIKLKLMDGSTDEADRQNPAIIYKAYFKTYYITLNITDTTGSDALAKKPKEMTFAELREEIRHLNAQQIDPTPLWLEYHKKIAQSFSPIAFILIGLPLALLARRGERLIGFALSLGVFVTYYLMLLGANAFALKGLLTPQVAMWLPNVVVGLTGLVLLYRAIES